MNTAIAERPCNVTISKTILNYKRISPFKNIKILVEDQAELKQAVAVLFKHGYAWGDDRQTQTELFYGAQHEHIYASYTANITFGVSCDDDYAVIKAANLKDYLNFKAPNLEKTA